MVTMVFTLLQKHNIVPTILLFTLFSIVVTVTVVIVCCIRDLVTESEAGLWICSQAFADMCCL